MVWSESSPEMPIFLVCTSLFASHNVFSRVYANDMCIIDIDIYLHYKQKTEFRFRMRLHRPRHDMTE